MLGTVPSVRRSRKRKSSSVVSEESGRLPKSRKKGRVGNGSRERFGVYKSSAGEPGIDERLQRQSWYDPPLSKGLNRKGPIKDYSKYYIPIEIAPCSPLPPGAYFG